MTNAPLTDNNRILVVDDNPSVLEAFRMILGNPTGDGGETLDALANDLLGKDSVPTAAMPHFSISCCSQGEEAANLARERNRAGEPFAVAFVDVRMPPGWDGITTIEELWRHDDRLQVVICSAYSDFSWQEITARLGRNDRLLILKKPFDTIEVQQLATSLTAKWSLLQRNQQQMRDLRQAEHRLKTLIDNNIALISLKDLDGRYLLVNRSLADRSGVSEDDFIGSTDAELFADQRRVLQERDLLAMQKGLTETEEEDPRLASGNRMLTCRFVLTDASDRPYALCSMATDITARRQLEQQLQQSQKLEAVGRLAGGIAHDFNNLLTAILGFAKLLESTVADKDQVAVKEIVKASERAADLIQQLLAYSRQQKLEPKDCDLNELIADATRLLDRLVGSPFTIDCRSPDRPVTVRLDPTQLTQVLINLVVNARDAMPKGGTITITGARDEQRQQAILTVADQGSGIAPEVLPQIFEPFFTTKAEGEGTGLGLATVQGIVDQSNGSIEVDAILGQGTTFTIRFPLISPIAAAGEERNQRILVVDDVHPVRTLASQCLQRAGYEVLSASSARSALHEIDCAPGPIDLLLTDVVMPVTTGPQLAALLREQRPDLPVIFMSGYADEHLDDVPAQDCLQKPFTINELLNRVRQRLKTPGAATT